MELDHLRELVVLSQTLNFSQAAKELHISQSSLSKHVANIEKEVGFQIFKRSTTDVELTNAGDTYLENVSNLLRVHKSAIKASKQIEGDDLAKIRISGPMLNGPIISLLTKSRQNTSQAISVSFIDTGVQDCHKPLLLGETDIAIGFDYGRDHPDIHYDHLFNLPFGIACHADHALAQKEKLSIIDLDCLNVLTYPIEKRQAYHCFIQSVCAKYQVTPHFVYSQDNAVCFPEQRDIVYFGIHAPVYTIFNNGIIVRTIDNCSEKFAVTLMRRENETNPPVLEFCKTILQSNHSNSPE